MSDSGKEFLQSVYKRMTIYKELAEKAFEQVPDEALFHQPNEESNSIAIIVQHMSGNMISRWTDFLTSDGEKSWRKRDLEFEPGVRTRQEMLDTWNSGWQCFFNTLSDLNATDLTKTIRIREEELTVLDALNRQLAHYPYHVGQIVFYAKIMKNGGWQSLSIPKKSVNSN